MGRQVDVCNIYSRTRHHLVKNNNKFVVKNDKCQALANSSDDDANQQCNSVLK